MTDVQTNWVTFVPGGRRRIIGDGDKLMMVQIEFDNGAVVAAHSHPHEPATYVISGEIEFTLSGNTRTLGPSQWVLIPSNEVHSVVVKKDSILLDSFSPPREDFR